MNRKKINFKNYGIFVVFIVLVIILMILSPNAFAKPRNLINVVKQASINGVLACGMMFVIIAGGIDLSAGSVVALSGVVAAYLAQMQGIPIILPILGALGTGALIGLINGFGAAYAELPPFIITLATMSIVRGAALILSGGSPVFGLQEQFEGIAGISIANVIPILVLYFLLIAVFSGFILNKTVFGRHVYAIGGNSITAKVSGINVKSMLLRVYIICGVFSGIAGLLIASRTMQGSPTVGVGYEMDAIAAVVIGGVSMSGGSGKWYGTIIGALLLALISNGLDILGVSSNFQQIIKGIIIAVAVYLDLRGKKTSA
ncbi:ribose/xylose/arabinose/galactoside ABC-type transport system permease subunit [Oribacterium sinus]|jgi:inner-membrane translocator|uniref:Ribose/xylose/arabinose/galactoside ABC-type transport system permease subunit n=1 Tax=Oribacterium sinus TaxID=237576 RepID=A0A7W9W1F2_9FIRM|nr:ABC transporter permease [Oribacterium sinus]MBB6040142.1 ribose/xylose/arabinose/galactoside ABC-type transport system permease subunit [Oribacterium sinus]